VQKWSETVQGAHVAHLLYKNWLGKDDGTLDAFVDFVNLEFYLSEEEDKRDAFR